MKQQELFEEIWDRYPKKLGKRQAFRHFRSQVKTKKDWVSIQTCLDNYLRYLEDEHVEYSYIQHGKTWFYNYLDWLEYKAPSKPKKRVDIEAERTDNYLKSMEDGHGNETVGVLRQILHSEK